MSCLVFSVPGSKAQLRRARTPSAVGALSSKPCWVWLLEIPVELLLHNVTFTLWCWSAADLLLARENCWQTGWVDSRAWSSPRQSLSALHGLAAEADEQGSVCNQLVLLLNTWSKSFCYWPWGRMVYWAEHTLVQTCCVCSFPEHIKRKV